MEHQVDPDDRPEDAARDDNSLQGEDPTTPNQEEPGKAEERAGLKTSSGDQSLKNVLSGIDFSNRYNLADLSKVIANALGPSLDGLARQQASWAKTLVVPDYSAMLFKIDPPKFDLPKFSYPGLDAAVRQVSESVLAGFDFGRFLPKIDFRELLKFEPAGGWDKWWADWWPPNWPKDIDLDAVQAILNDEGLPLVWVLRAEIVAEVLAATTRNERVAVLVARRAEVAEDCLAVLEEIGHPRLLSQQRLFARAVEALAAGYDEAAQSLAVLVTETAVLQAGAAGHIDGLVNRQKLYERVKDAVRVDLDEAPASLLRVAASLAPVAGFFTPFFPHRGDPVPEAMSRHVTVHFAVDEHYTEEHAVAAVLLMVSVVRGLQQGWEIWESQADEPESQPNDGTARL